MSNGMLKLLSEHEHLPYDSKISHAHFHAIQSSVRTTKPKNYVHYSSIQIESLAGRVKIVEQLRSDNDDKINRLFSDCFDRSRSISQTISSSVLMHCPIIDNNEKHAAYINQAIQNASVGMPAIGPFIELTSLNGTLWNF